MAHKATLEVEHKKYEDKVLECEYEFTQPIKVNGHPSGTPNGGLIHFTILSPDDSDTLFHEWMMNKTEHKDGKFIFTLINDTRKTVLFKHAFCIRLAEYFDEGSDVQMYMKITISAAEIDFGEGSSVVFKNDKKA